MDIINQTHPLTCGGKRHDEAHIEYQKEYGGDLGELVSTPKGLMCPVPGCGYKQNWNYDEEDLEKLDPRERLKVWINQLPINKTNELILVLIEMLAEQEIVSIGVGTPYYYNTGEPLI